MKKNAIITGYFNGKADWQRDNKTWDADYNAVKDLIDSIKPDIDLIIIHDCFENVVDTDSVKHYRVPKMPRYGGWAKWIRAHSFLLMNPDIQYAYIVDATDVQMVKDPFPFMEKGKLYIGDEPSNVGSVWMRAFNTDEQTIAFMDKYHDETLLNCGVCGADRDTLIELTSKMIERLYELEGDYRNGKTANTNIDMGIYNMVLREQYAGRINHGPHITTKYGHWEPYETATAWFKHK